MSKVFLLEKNESGVDSEFRRGKDRKVEFHAISCGSNI